MIVSIQFSLPLPPPATPPWSWFNFTDISMQIEHHSHTRECHSRLSLSSWVSDTCRWEVLDRYWKVHRSWLKTRHVLAHTTVKMISTSQITHVADWPSPPPPPRHHRPPPPFSSLAISLTKKSKKCRLTQHLEEYRETFCPVPLLSSSSSSPLSAHPSFQRLLQRQCCPSRFQSLVRTFLHAQEFTACWETIIKLIVVCAIASAIQKKKKGKWLKRYLF